MRNLPNRIWIFIALCFICAIGLSAHYYATRSSKVSLTQTLLSSDARESVPGQARQIFFRYTGVDDHYGKVAVVDYPGLGVPHFIDRLSCDVVYFAHGHGICLYTEPPLYTTFAAELFDAQFQKRFHIPLQGGPSRTRISPDGKLAALTVFVTGHGYASVDFITQTLLIDTASGKTIADLESFRITRDGQIFQAKDFNFWGVTFTGPTRIAFIARSPRIESITSFSAMGPRAPAPFYTKMSSVPQSRPMGNMSPTKSASVSTDACCGNCTCSTSRRCRKRRSPKNAALMINSNGSTTSACSIPSPTIPAARARRRMFGV